MYSRFYSFGVEKEVVEDILERRRNGQSLDEIAEEYAYLTKREINAIIAQIEQE